MYAILHQRTGQRSCLGQLSVWKQRRIWLRDAESPSAVPWKTGCSDGRSFEADIAAEAKEAIQLWLDNKDNYEESKKATDLLLPMLQDAEEAPALQAIKVYEDHLIKRSQWIFGGDGWAYDIGYGGLDHVLASGENVNVLVFDTEVYSNTGGQASKATPTAAIAKICCQRQTL